MHTYLIQKATTNVSVELRIIDSTDGTPETGVVFNTAGIDLQYRRDGAASTAITEATLAALTTAHTDGGFLHIGNGVYRLDLPDAACATGVDKVIVHGTVTGMVVIGCVIQLVDYDPFDSVRMGMTALPNAAADAAGGLPTSDAGGLDLDTQLAATNEITAARMGALTDWINGGRLDLILDELTTNVDAIETDTQDLQTQVGTAGAGLTNINLPNQTMDIVGNITGNLSGSVGSVTAGVTLANGAHGGASTTITLQTPIVANATQIEGSDATDQINAACDTALSDYDPPTNAEMEARTIASASYATATAQTTAQNDLDIITGADGVNLLSATQASIDAIEADTNELQLDDTPAAIAALNDLSSANVNAEVVDALNVDTYAEPGQGTPAATASLATKIGYLYKAWRNRHTSTSSEYNLMNDDATTVDQQATQSDNGTTFDRGEISSGP